MNCFSVKVGFSKSRHTFPVLGWLIRIVEGTPYSHTYLRFTHRSGVDVVYEASGSMLRFVSTQFFLEKNEVVYEHAFTLAPENKKHLESFCMKQAGTDYGMKQLFGIALVRLFKLKKNPFSDGNKSQVCSELIGYFLEEILEYDTGLDLDIAGPKDIYRYIRGLQSEVHN